MFKTLRTCHSLDPALSALWQPPSRSVAVRGRESAGRPPASLHGPSVQSRWVQTTAHNQASAL